MSIISASRSWEKQTAYQLAKSHVSSKAAQAEQAGGKEQAEAEASIKEDPEKKSDKADTDVFLSSLSSPEEQNESLFSKLSGLSASQPDNDSDSFQMRSSASEDSVGQLAAMLARAETKLDVLQVSGKAIRALVNLKASAATAKGDDAKKLAAKIKRMEKLIKRIEKKLKHLDKEESMEREQKRAIEKEEKQKAEQIENELKSRRKKRRKDEKNYANRELAEDEKEANSEMTASLSGISGASAPSLDAVSGMDAAMGGELSAAVSDAGSLDITV